MVCNQTLLQVVAQLELCFSFYVKITDNDKYMITFLYSIVVVGEYYNIISNAITRDCNDEVEYLPPCYFVILQLIPRHPSVYM